MVHSTRLPWALARPAAERASAIEATDSMVVDLLDENDGVCV